MRCFKFSYWSQKSARANTAENSVLSEEKSKTAKEAWASNLQADPEILQLQLIFDYATHPLLLRFGKQVFFSRKIRYWSSQIFKLPDVSNSFHDNFCWNESMIIILNPFHVKWALKGLRTRSQYKIFLIPASSTSYERFTTKQACRKKLRQVRYGKFYLEFLSVSTMLIFLILKHWI